MERERLNRKLQEFLTRPIFNQAEFYREAKVNRSTFYAFIRNKTNLEKSPKAFGNLLKTAKKYGFKTH